MSVYQIPRGVYQTPRSVLLPPYSVSARLQALLQILRGHLHQKRPRQLPRYHHHLLLQLGLAGLAERGR
jgi:hypothetical protein